MNVGMLWFDGDRKVAVGERIERAAAYYKEKYGRPPNLCLVHPSTLDGESLQVVSIQVETSATVLPDHFWLGVEAPGESPDGR